MSGRASLWIAVLIFGASHAVVRRLNLLGAEFANGDNPITFCNVLMVGNLIAFLALVVLFRRDCTLQCPRWSARPSMAGSRRP